VNHELGSPGAFFGLGVGGIVLSLALLWAWFRRKGWM